MNPKLAGPESRRHGFSLIEVVIAIGVVSFALLSILGVLSISMTVHQDASIDSVLSLMTESALQEVRNYNTPANSLSSGATSTYNFNKLTSYTGYIYFDQDGQITADAYWTGVNSGGTPTISTSTTSANQSTEVGINMGGSTLAANAGKSGVPLTATLNPLPAGTYYTCQITTSQPKLSNGAVTSSMYLIQLTFSWPPGATAANHNLHTRTVLTSLSNNTN